jgi:hypothetical protein
LLSIASDDDKKAALTITVSDRVTVFVKEGWERSCRYRTACGSKRDQEALLIAIAIAAIPRAIVASLIRLLPQAVL